MQPVTPSSTDVTVTFRVLDSTTFLPYESLTAASSGLALWYRKGATGALTAITEADHTNLTDAHSDGKIKHIDDGWYRLDLVDAAVPTAEHEVTTYGGTATGYVILGGAIVGKPVEVGGTAQTGDSFARIGAAGAGLTAVGDTAGTTTLLSRITALLQTKSEADTAHGLLATATALSTLQADATTLLSRVTGTVALAATALSNAVWTNGRGANLDNLDVTVSSRSTYAGGAVASVTDPVTVGTNNDKTGYGLSSAAVQAIWDALTPALTTAGSIGKLLVDRIDAAISSRSTYAGGDTAGTTTLLSRVTALIQTKAEADTAHGLLATSANLATVAGYLDTEVADILASVDAEIAAIKLKTDNLPTDPADQSQVEAAITSAQGALSVLIGALNDIAGADVWAAMDDAAANKISDHMLRRGWADAATSADGDALSFRSLLGAVAKLVNRVGIVGSTLTVYENDDTTALGTQALTGDPAAEPVTGANTV